MSSSKQDKSLRRGVANGQSTVELVGSFVISALIVAVIFAAGPAGMNTVFSALLGSIQEHYADQ